MPWGGLIQLSGEGLCSAALTWVLDAQAKCEPVAWVGSSESVPFAPDLARAGVDLAKLLWVQPGVGCESLSSLQACLRATELLLRSGAFGCVVVDLHELGEGARNAAWLRKPSWQSRVAALARKHQSAVLLLQSHSALGALVRTRIGYRQGRGHVLRHKSTQAVAAHVLDIPRDNPDGVLFATKVAAFE